MTYELCPHGRHIGAVCLPCEEEKLIRSELKREYLSVQEEIREMAEEYIDPYDSPLNWEWENTGLNARYYDIPGHIKGCQDLIEWLGLDFSNGNILKSIVRENNPNGGKETDSLYEAEKRFYFASRHLERVRNLQKTAGNRQGFDAGFEERSPDESD